MDPQIDSRSDDAQWLKPRMEQQGLGRYLQILQERIWLIVGILAVTTGVSLAYVLTADKVYETESDLLITPVPRSDPALSGLSLLRESNYPTREVESAARLVTTRSVAEGVREELNLDRSARSLLNDVRAEPVAGSNILAITARANDPELASDLANTFGEVAISERTKELHSQLDTKIESLRKLIKSTPREDSAGEVTGRGELRAQKTQLETLRAGKDPTMRVVTMAPVPTRPVAPRPLFSISAGILSGLILGIGGAFVLQSIDPRIRREEQLRNLYRIPILARIPTEKRGKKGRCLVPDDLSPPTLESYRTLRASLMAFQRGREGSRSILITGSSPGEGKTTTTINLAYALAHIGKRVILVEADLRRPAIGTALGIHADFGVTSVLLDDIALNDALIDVPNVGPGLRVLLAGSPASGADIALSLPTSQTLIDEATALADFVIIDSPPLAEVTDALPIAQYVDDVLLVVRLGKTRLTKLVELGEVLARHDIKPMGFAVTGTGRASQHSYYSGRPADGPVRIESQGQAERGS